MTLRKLAVLSILAVSLCRVLFALPEKPQFAQEKSDLTPDPAAHFGTLPNGVRYVIMPNKEPKDRASLRLLVMAGALHENDDQRGLAHYLEHLAFNGSTHYPSGTLVEFFQRMGMSFGGDTNAYTSFDHTAYMIDLPDTKPATVEEGLRVFSDFASGLFLGEKEVEKERGIILSEKRARDSVEYRQLEAEYKFLLGDSRIPSRLPIGMTSTIEQAKRPLFADFYDTWYRPERLAVIVVGDFDVKAVETQITAQFGSLKARAPQRQNPNMGAIAHFEGIRTAYHFEPEAAATTVSIQALAPYSPEDDTGAKRLEYLPRELALSMLNRRLSILAKEEGAPFRAAEVDVSEQYDFVRHASIQLDCKPELWKKALETGEQELRRALKYGFQPAELTEAVAKMRNDLEQGAKTALTRRSDELATGIVSALVRGQVFTAPVDDLKLYGPALDKVTPEQCVTALRKDFELTGRYVYVTGNAKIEEPSTATIESVYKASAAVAVNPPNQVEDSKFGYTEFGAPGTVIERKKVEDLDVSLVTFSNGVRVNLKRTDFEAGQIRVFVRVGNGQLIEPQNQPGLAFFTTHTFIGGGLGKHSIDELQRILAGKTLGLDFKVASDALTFAGTTNREDLLTQLQLFSAFIADPGYRPEGARLAQKAFEQFYVKLEHTPNGPLQRDIPRLLASGDPRFGLPDKESIFARSLLESKTWLAPQLREGAIEIAIVGDLDVDATIDAVGKTFGTLPQRSAKPKLEERRVVSFPSPLAKDFAVSTEIPKGMLAIFWPTTDARDIRVVRRLRLLADVLSDRLRIKIREQLGESYSPHAFSEPSDAYRNYGVLGALLTVDPAKSSEIMIAALAIADDLVKNGVTSDELERAKKPVLTTLRETARTNAYWLNSVLAGAREFPERFDWCRNRYSDNEAVTVDELNDLARRYLPTDRCFKFVIAPEKKP
jgi:zinc protease